MLNGVGAHKALFSCFVKNVCEGNIILDWWPVVG